PIERARCGGRTCSTLRRIASARLGLLGVRKSFRRPRRTGRTERRLATSESHPCRQVSVPHPVQFSAWSFFPLFRSPRVISGLVGDCRVDTQQFRYGAWIAPTESAFGGNGEIRNGIGDVALGGLKPLLGTGDAVGVVDEAEAKFSLRTKRK